MRTLRPRQIISEAPFVETSSNHRSTKTNYSITTLHSTNQLQLHQRGSFLAVSNNNWYVKTVLHTLHSEKSMSSSSKNKEQSNGTPIHLSLSRVRTGFNPCRPTFDSLGNRSFAVASPNIYNSLPAFPGSFSCLDSFRAKTHLCQFA